MIAPHPFDLKKLYNNIISDLQKRVDEAFFYLTERGIPHEKPITNIDKLSISVRDTFKITPTSAGGVIVTFGFNDLAWQPIETIPKDGTTVNH